MRIFICAGEPSGDLHGANLVRALRLLRPGVQCVGYGGERMTEAGCKILYPLCSLAVMGLLKVLTNAHRFLRLLFQTNGHFKNDRPDAVILIDYPGFNWWVAKLAHSKGIPVFYFVPPQLWAWAGWRVKKMRKNVDHVLCNLPFEEAWYKERGVQAHYIGHPYFDELPRQRLDPDFVSEQQARMGTVIGLLPGSRTQEVEHNLTTLVRSATAIHAAKPETRFLFACFKRSHQEYVDRYLQSHGLSCIETCCGRTAEIIHLSHVCIAVSGSVGLELLYREKPSVIVYRARKLLLPLIRFFKRSKYISLVNLLAEEELFPEFLTDRCESLAVTGHVLHWLNSTTEYQRKCAELAKLKHRVAETGACERGASFVLTKLESKNHIEQQRDSFSRELLRARAG